jgi:hypothetical protein
MAKTKLKDKTQSGGQTQWLKPTILGTWEAKIKRMEV